MSAHRTSTQADVAARAPTLDDALCRALAEPAGARARLLARVQAPAVDAAGARARLQAACCIVLAIGIADDDYRGFEDATAVIVDAGDPLSDGDPDAALLVVAGALVTRQFRSLDDPSLESLAARIVAALPNPGDRKSVV